MLYIIASVAVLLWLLVYLTKWLRNRRFSLAQETELRPQPKVHLGDTAGVRSIQGARAHMEDTYAAAVAVGGDERRAYFAVYDGHGGHRASDFTAEKLHELVLNNSQHKFDEEPVLALENGFKQLDHLWLTLATKHNWDDGTTAVAALIVDNVLYVANVGDSRAVLSNSGKAVDMSHDHKPIREDEKQRIEKLGGRIIHYGTWRVEGVLAVTRAIGDRRLKKYVSAVPEIKMRPLKDGDDMLILASDGVWDVLSSQAAVDIVSQCRDRPGSGSASGSGSGSGGAGSASGKGSGSSGGSSSEGEADVQEAARRLTDTAYKRGSMDNITSLVIDLRKYRRAALAAERAGGGGSGGAGSAGLSSPSGGAGGSSSATKRSGDRESKGGPTPS